MIDLIGVVVCSTACVAVIMKFAKYRCEKAARREWQKYFRKMKS